MITALELTFFSDCWMHVILKKYIGKILGFLEARSVYEYIFRSSYCLKWFLLVFIQMIFLIIMNVREHEVDILFTNG